MPQSDRPAEVDSSPDDLEVGDEGLPSSPREPQPHSIVVGIGASAGGLEAASQLLTEMPDTLGTTFVVIQHLDSNHHSALAELLAKKTALPVTEVHGDTAVERDHVYVIPPSRFLTTEETVSIEHYRALQHELATTREQLNSSIEDLEAANEELRTSNDDAMSTNEQLQSSNEELETSREELQSLNEELTTLNHQLETKLAELQQTTDDLDNLLTSSSVPTLFLDLDLRIRLFTPSCRSLFQLIESDIGRPLSDIAKQFDDDSLLKDAADVVRDLCPRQKHVQGKNHHSHLRMIRPYRTEDDRIQGVVLTFADVTELQRIEQKSLRQRDEIDTIYRTASVGLCVLDRDFRYVRINERLAEINGMPADQHLGKTVREVIPNLADTMEPILRKIFETGEAIHDLEIRGETQAVPGAEHIWLEDWTPLTDRNGNVVAVNGVAVEVTQHRRAEQHLRESENRLRLAARAARFGYYDSDLMSGVVYWSPELRRIVDYPLDAPVSVRAGSLPDFVHPEDRERVQEETAAALDPQGTGEIESEHRIIQRSGEERWVLMRGITLFEQHAGKRVPVRTIGVVVDIHHRRLAEERLRESEHRFRALVEATAQLVWTTDAEGKRIYDSSSWRDFTGQAADALQESGWLNAVHPDDRQRTGKAWQKAVREGVPYEADYRLRHRSGDYRWMSSRAAPIRDSNQAIRGWIGMNSDISERKEFESALQESRKRAEVANQSKSDFLANMSHEIRTPMTAILGYADVLAENLDDPCDLQNIETIRRNGRFLLEIVNDILDLSKIEADKMEVIATEVSPEAVICEVVFLMNVRAEEKAIPLKLETVGKLPATIKCDGVRLRQILLNLVGNAIKFTEEGEVRLVAELLPNKEQIRFDVVDTGIGIGEEQQSRLFQPFNQADNSITRSHGGTGLGLAISQRLANLLGGYLQVHSTPGRGSRFSVTVSTGSLENVQLIEPQMGDTAAAISQEPSSQQQLDCCVLVVDDRRDIRFLASHFLEKAGARVEMCENGQQAIELLTAGPETPPIDAVIMDISMPVMDGYTAASRLRQSGITLPIIALTANAMEGDRDKCLESGFTDYTTKPLNKQRLVEMVARYSSGRCDP